MITPAASGPLGHIALVHENPERAEDLARLLRTAGHRVTIVVPGRRIVQGVVDCSPDLVLASHLVVDPPMASVVKGVRQALGADVRILVLYGLDPQGFPPEVDDVQRAEPMQPTELQIRVSRLLQELAERRVLQKNERAARPLQDVLGVLARRRRRRALLAPLAPQRRDAEGGARAGDAVRQREAPAGGPGTRVRPLARAGQARALLRGRRGRLALELPQERAAALEQGPGRHPAARPRWRSSSGCSR